MGRNAKLDWEWVLVFIMVEVGKRGDKGCG